MALQSTLRERARPGDIVRILLIVVATIAAIVALSAMFGFNGTGPWTDLTIDPGAALGLPY